ncbi:hypothetical protein [Rhizobium leguminosarum]|uniref:hypothetical protein n=1 Tax=Rhizobium leguminosarum TaxID=384 RepID=UPI001FE1C14F|nr:hypothetical protein [Rhizobium leguminosarum]
MATQDNTVVAFPTPDDPAPSSFDKIWGKKIKSHGYAAIPTILIRSQHRLGVNSTQFCLLMHLLDLFWSPDRPPFLQSSSWPTGSASSNPVSSPT